MPRNTGGGSTATRIHGTTRQQVHLLFQEEKPHLLSLPAGRFPSFEEGRRSVHWDGYIEVAKAHYSVPPEYTGRQVWVRWDGHLVRIFNSKMESLVVHVQAEPGTFQTKEEHLHARKISQAEQVVVSLLHRAALLGPHVEQWVPQMLFRQKEASLFSSSETGNRVYGEVDGVNRSVYTASVDGGTRMVRSSALRA